MTKPRVGIVIGTRPEVIKLAPVIDRLRSVDWCETVLMPSGQHSELLRQSLDEYGYGAAEIPPAPPPTEDYREQVQNLAAVLGDMMRAAEPSIVLVQGDTATALAGTHAASALGIPVAHVEAGLRTYDLAHPFPEEGIRQEIGRLATLHFAPTPLAQENLIREGVSPASVVVTGNTVVDSLLRMMATSPPPDAEKFLLVTLHRRELGASVSSVLGGINSSLARHADLKAVVLKHPNRVLSADLAAEIERNPNIRLIGPQSHRSLIELLRQAAVVVTDSGGLQEEAATLGVPLVIARKTTERPEVLSTGRTALAGFEAEMIGQSIDWALSLPASPGFSDVLGDGNAAHRIEAKLADFLRQAGC